MEEIVESQRWHSIVGVSGRTVIPIELRDELDAKTGARLVWEKTKQGIVIRPFHEIVAEIQAYAAQFGSPDELWSEELIDERKQEAAREISDS